MGANNKNKIMRNILISINVLTIILLIQFCGADIKYSYKEKKLNTITKKEIPKMIKNHESILKKRHKKLDEYKQLFEFKLKQMAGTQNERFYWEQSLNASLTGTAFIASQMETDDKNVKISVGIGTLALGIFSGFIIDLFDRKASEKEQKEIIEAITTITNTLQEFQRQWIQLQTKIVTENINLQSEFMEEKRDKIQDLKIDIAKIKVKISTIEQMEGIMTKEERNRDLKNYNNKLENKKRELDNIEKKKWSLSSEKINEYTKEINQLMKKLDTNITKYKVLYERIKNSID